MHKSKAALLGVLAVSSLCCLACGGTQPADNTPDAGVSHPDAAPGSDVPFKELAAPLGRLFGTQIDPVHLTMGSVHTTDDAPYERFLLREFSLIAPGNNFKMRHLQPTEGDFNFDVTDQVMNYAEQKALAVHGHVLIWGNETSVPSWITDKEEEASNADYPLSRAKLLSIMEQHVTTVVSRYKGRMRSWDVVNEAFCDPQKESGCIVEGGEAGGMDGSIWRRIIGPEFIELALRAARAADPEVKLIVNENGVELTDTPKSEKFFSFIKGLVDKGVPLDGIGIQMHIPAAHFAPLDADQRRALYESVGATFARFNQLGLDVLITELDVFLVDEGRAPTAEELTLQAEIFGNMLRICLEAARCPSFTMWGFTDKYSWIPEGKPGHGFATITDDEMQPKPAYFALKETLRQMQTGR